MKSAFDVIVCLMVVSLLFFQASPAQPANRTLSLTIDNDGLLGSDRCFTGGGSLSWAGVDLGDLRSSPWLKWIPVNKEPGGMNLLSFSLGFNVYTPDDIERSDLIVNDRPYAGYLYLGAAILSIHENSHESIEFNIGLVGPHSNAEGVQSFLHKVFGGADPKGWDNQLSDELIFQLFYEKKWKLLQFRKKTVWGYELIPSLGMGLGNAIVSGNLGTFFRFGLNLPNDFGIPQNRPAGLKGSVIGHKNPAGIYGLIGFNLFLNIRNIFLDGNTFTDSHSVKKRLFMGDLTFGVVAQFSGFRISLMSTFWTKRFNLESSGHRFVSLTISYLY